MNAHPASESPRERAARVLAELLPRSEPLLRGVARHHSRNAADADDAFQSAMLKFVEKFRDPDPSIAVPWLVTTVKREAWQADRRRRAHPEKSLDGPLNSGDGEPGELASRIRDESPEPEELVARAEELSRRKELIRRLKPNERICLYLKATGLSYEEIMEVTGWTYTKVNRLMAEGRARLFELEAEQSADSVG